MTSQLAISLSHAQMLERARQLSEHDPLTGVHNRRYLEKVLLRDPSLTAGEILKRTKIFFNPSSYLSSTELTTGSNSSART